LQETLRILDLYDRFHCGSRKHTYDWNLAVIHGKGFRAAALPWNKLPKTLEFIMSCVKGLKMPSTEIIPVWRYGRIIICHGEKKEK
jgi:hypothetical protein